MPVGKGEMTFSVEGTVYAKAWSKKKSQAFSEIREPRCAYGRETVGSDD